MQRPLPAMDVLETAGVKKFLSSVCLGGFTILFTLIKFQAGTRTVTIRHLLGTVLYLLLWSFSLSYLKKQILVSSSK